MAHAPLHGTVLGAREHGARRRRVPLTGMRACPTCAPGNCSGVLPGTQQHRRRRNGSPQRRGVPRTAGQCGRKHDRQRRRRPVPVGPHRTARHRRPHRQRCGRVAVAVVCLRPTAALTWHAHARASKGGGGGADAAGRDCLSVADLALRVHVYQLDEDGGVEDRVDGDKVPAAREWVLPSRELHGLWERYRLVASPPGRAWARATSRTSAFIGLADGPLPRASRGAASFTTATSRRASLTTSIRACSFLTKGSTPTSLPSIGVLACVPYYCAEDARQRRPPAHALRAFAPPPRRVGGWAQHASNVTPMTTYFVLVTWAGVRMVDWVMDQVGGSGLAGWASRNQ